MAREEPRVISAKISDELETQFEAAAKEGEHTSETLRRLIRAGLEQEEDPPNGVRASFDRLIRAGDVFLAGAFVVLLAFALAALATIALPLATLSPDLEFLGYLLSGTLATAAAATYLLVGTAARLAGVSWLWGRRVATGREWWERVRRTDP